MKTVFIHNLIIIYTLNRTPDKVMDTEEQQYLGCLLHNNKRKFP